MELIGKLELIWLCCISLFILMPSLSGKAVTRYTRENNTLESKNIVLCKKAHNDGPVSTCWSSHGCYVRQIYEHGTRKSKHITYDCIHNTELFQHFLTCGLNYKRGGSTTFHYGMGKVRVLSLCCGTTFCNKAVPTVPEENWINCK